MDAEKLIGLVFERQALWNCADSDHRNTFVLNKYWQEVALELGATCDEVRTKWKALRDKFRRTIQSQPTLRSGQGAEDTMKSSWPLFRQLYFLLDQFTPRQSSGNFKKSKLNDKKEVGEEEEERQAEDAGTPIEFSTIPIFSMDENILFSATTPTTSSIATPSPMPTPRPTSPPPPTSTPNITATNIKRKRQRSSTDVFVSIEQEKLEYMKKKREKQEDDDNRDFFNSLLPLIKNFDVASKISFRKKVLELVEEHVKCNEMK